MSHVCHSSPSPPNMHALICPTGEHPGGWQHMPGPHKMCNLEPECGPWHTVEPEICQLCHIPKATGSCLHVIIKNDQVTMSIAAWTALTNELQELRNMEGQKDE